MRSDLFGRVQTRRSLEVLARVRTCSNLFGHVLTWSDAFDHVWSVFGLFSDVPGFVGFVFGQLAKVGRTQP